MSEHVLNLANLSGDKGCAVVLEHLVPQLLEHFNELLKVCKALFKEPCKVEMWKRGYQGVNVAGHCMQLPVVLDKLGLPLFEFLEQAYVSNIVCANKHEDRLFRSSRVFNYVLENRVLKFVTPLNFLRHKFELHLRFFAFRKKPLLYAFAEKVDPEGID